VKILIADDNHFYRMALKGILSEWGYKVVEAQDGTQAWSILKAPEPPQLAILDWMMPGLSGPELCRRVRALKRAEPTYLIILTNLDGKENSLGALRAGADDFIHKPFDRDQLEARLNVGRRIVNLQTTQTVVFTLARAVEAKSSYTQGHAERVTRYALGLAADIGISDADVNILRNGGLLHDLGKISIPDAILDKPGPLTPEEYAIVKKHPELGVEILKPLHSLKEMLPLIRWHHERLDGRGYPDRLGGNEIPFLVRILSVADVYDALSSERPYRPAIPHATCLDIMRKDAAEGGLDPELVAQFAALQPTSFEDGQSESFHDCVPVMAVTMPLRECIQEIA
jgi:putative two-component system response regulator